MCQLCQTSKLFNRASLPSCQQPCQLFAAQLSLCDIETCKAYAHVCHYDSYTRISDKVASHILQNSSNRLNEKQTSCDTCSTHLSWVHIDVGSMVQQQSCHGLVAIHHSYMQYTASLNGHQGIMCTAVTHTGLTLMSWKELWCLLQAVSTRHNRQAAWYFAAYSRSLVIAAGDCD